MEMEDPAFDRYVPLDLRIAQRWTQIDEFAYCRRTTGLGRAELILSAPLVPYRLAATSNSG